MISIFTHINGLLKNLLLIFASMLPVMENKASIAMAVTMRMKWKSAFFCSTTGNFLPMPFLVYYREHFLEKFKKNRFIHSFLTKTEVFLEKRSHRFHQNALLGLAFVISIPFTGVGAWGGFFISSLLNLDKKHSVLAIFIGILISGLITSLCLYGLFQIPFIAIL